MWAVPNYVPCPRVDILCNYANYQHDNQGCLCWGGVTLQFHGKWFYRVDFWQVVEFPCDGVALAAENHWTGLGPHPYVLRPRVTHIIGLSTTFLLGLASVHRLQGCVDSRGTRNHCEPLTMWTQVRLVHTTAIATHNFSQLMGLGYQQS